MIVYTVGHSTRAIEDFIALLKAFDIETLVDVRTIARSRYNPQYNEAELDASLAASGISYLRLTGLGGLRHTTGASVNKAWENLSFRGYADYMQTPEFLDSLGQLTRIADRETDGHHVRRGRPVALPPVLDRRRLAGPRCIGPGHLHGEVDQAAPVDGVRPDNRQHDHVPGCAGLTLRRTQICAE